MRAMASTTFTVGAPLAFRLRDEHRDAERGAFLPAAALVELDLIAHPLSRTGNIVWHGDLLLWFRRAGRRARRSRQGFPGAPTRSSAPPARAAPPGTSRDGRDADSRSPRRTCPRRRAASARRSCARPGPPR